MILDVVVITTGTVLISEATVLSSVREAIDLTTVAGLVDSPIPSPTLPSVPPPCAWECATSPAIGSSGCSTVAAW
jgi:hypothetical protein